MQKSDIRKANPYDLDPEVKSILKIETFQQGKFTTHDFVEKTSTNLLKHANPKTFDPKPFIRTFERSIDELLKLRESVQEESKVFEATVQLTEDGHRKKLLELKTAFEDVVHSFESLETRINEVGNTAIRIGEQLEIIDKQRLRASESKDLIEYFMAFNRGDIEKLENLRTYGGKDGQLKAAVIARRLNAIAKDVDIPGAEAARERIEKYCEILEKELLEQFDRAYKERNLKTMQHYAKTLQEFNGCESCVKLYVNQHQFFITKINVGEKKEFLSSPGWDDLPNPRIPPPPIDQGLIVFYEEIKNTVIKEAININAVFPNPIGVMQVFLQQSLLSHAENNSTLAYLRSLAAVRAATTDLVTSLKSVEIRQEGSTKDNVNTKNEEDTKKNNTIAEVLDQCIEDLFVPYTEGERYLEKEKRSLMELYSSLLLKFTAYHAQQKHARSGSLFQRAVNQITSSSNPNQFGGANLMEIPVTDDDGNLGVDTATLMLKIHAEASKRSVKLCPPSELPKIASALFNVLLDFIGRQYVDVALESCLELMAAMDSKSETDFSVFAVVKVARDIIHLEQNHFQAVILPLASPSLAIHREITSDKNKFMMGVENKMNSAVQKMIDAIIARLSFFLSRQKRADFKPKDEEDLITNIATMPCNNCVEYIKKVNVNMNKYLDGKNFENFLTEVGILFHSMLLDHFKKFTVSPTGCLILSKDITKYQETFASFKIPQLDERFELLHQLGNLFVVKPEILKSVLNEGYLAKLEIRYVIPYLQMRTDFKSAGIDSLLGASAETGSNERNFHDKARARLTSMGLNIGFGESGRKWMTLA
nr:11762_t:CDS:10 [Entrophospora candida]